jgi:hypothetical protein
MAQEYLVRDGSGECYRCIPEAGVAECGNELIGIRIPVVGVIWRQNRLLEGRERRRLEVARHGWRARSRKSVKNRDSGISKNLMSQNEVRHMDHLQRKTHTE